MERAVAKVREHGGATRQKQEPEKRAIWNQGKEWAKEEGRRTERERRQRDKNQARVGEKKVSNW